MKIATWNINGIKARLETVQTWLGSASPDIACFQEIKSVDEGFPAEIFEEIGYNVAVHGQVVGFQYVQMHIAIADMTEPHYFKLRIVAVHHFLNFSEEVRDPG